MKKREASGNGSKALRLKEEKVQHPYNVKVDSLSTAEMQSLIRDLQKRQADLEERYRRLAHTEEESRDKYNSLLDFVPIGLVTLDQHKAILEINSYLSNLLQQEPQQLLGQDFSLLVADRDKKSFEVFCRGILRNPGKQTVQMLLQNGLHAELEVQLQGRREVAANGSMRMLVAVAAIAIVDPKDASIPGKVQEELQQLQMLLQESQAIAQIGSFKYDMEEDELEWSDEMYRIHGLMPGAIKPSLLYLIKHTFVDDQILIRETLFKAFRSKIPFSLTRRFLRPDGDMSYIHVTGKFCQEGKNLKLIGIAQDVTSSRKTEEEIKQKNEELILANRKLRNEIEGRQRVEEALIESEKKWRTLVENTPDVIARFDPELRHLFVNRAVEHETGIKPELLIGKTHKDFGMPSEYYEPYVSMVREVFRSGQQTHAYTFYDNPKEGRKYFYSITVPEFGADGEVKTVLSISRDITEAKQKENLLNGVLNSSIHGIEAIRAIRNDQHQITDFEWVLVNKAAETILQRSAEDLIGKTVLKVLPGNKESGLFNNFVHTIDTGETLNRIIHYNYDHLNGWYQVVAVKLEDGLVVTFADINDYKLTEKKLRRREAELLEAEAVGHMGTWSYNLKSGEFTCSKELENILGLPEDGLTTLSNFIGYIHPQDRSQIQDLISRAIVELQPFSREYRPVRPDGSVRWVSGRGKIIRDEKGFPLRLASTGHYRSERN